MHVLVTGGTGALGREVVRRLRESGHRPRILSRKPGEDDDWVQGDLVTGLGLELAVKGIDAIVHAASDPMHLRRYRATDVLGTRLLLTMARESCVKHAVYVSIVGMEGVVFPYYRSKLAAEAVVRENIVPWSILRATQFHTLMEIFLDGLSKLPGLAVVPFKWQFQPVDTTEVAARLVDIVTAEPAGMVPDFGGPEVTWPPHGSGSESPVSALSTCGCPSSSAASRPRVVFCVPSIATAQSHSSNIWP